MPSGRRRVYRFEADHTSLVHLNTFLFEELIPTNKLYEYRWPLCVEETGNSILCTRVYDDRPVTCLPCLVLGMNHATGI